MERLAAEHVEGAHISAVGEPLGLRLRHLDALYVGFHLLIAPLHGRTVLHGEAHGEVGMVVEDALQGISQPLGIDTVGQACAETSIVFSGQGLVHPFEEDTQLRLQQRMFSHKADEFKV